MTAGKPRYRVRLLLAALVLSVVTMLGLAINRYITIEQRLNYTISENVLWAAAQNEVELNQFITALADAASLVDTASFSQLEKRFDILWSRLSLYQQGVLAKSIENYPDLRAHIHALFEDLKAIEPKLNTSPDQAALLEMRLQIRRHIEPLRQITAVALSSDRSERQAVAMTQQEIKRELSLLVGALLTIIGGVVLYLWRAERRSRQHAEESIVARREANAAWRQLDEAIENINEGFVLYDADDRLVRCNQKYREIYALSAEILVPGITFKEVIQFGVERQQFHGADENPEGWIADRLLQRDAPFAPFEQALGDGRWLMVSDRLTSNGGRVGIRTDITEFKRHVADLEAARENLRAQAERMSDLAFENQRAHEVLNDAIESIGEGFVLYDANDKLVMCNSRLKAFFPGVAPIIEPGLAFEGFIRAAFLCGHMEANRPLEEEILERKQRRRQGTSATFIEALSDGRWLQISNRMMQSGGIVTVFNDISELKNRELALVEARNDLEEQAQRMKTLMEVADAANRSKSDFLAMVSHEIRTPMNAVLGLSGLLAETKLDGEQAHFVECIEESGVHLLGLINNILDFSRLEAHKNDIRPVATDLRALIIGAGKMVSVLAERKGLTLGIDMDPAMPNQIMVDAAHLNQILINLLGNAVKFTKVGHVHLRLDCLDDRLDEVQWRIQVSDTGVGVSAALRATIFEPFERGRTEDNGQITGTGLGLAITHRLITMMGGTISLLDQEAPGTTFEIVLTCPKATMTALPVLPAPVLHQAASVETRPLRILVAEDTPASQLVIRTMLEKRGHQVMLTEDGQFALEAASARDFDLILLDIQMPRKSGYEAVADIRRLPGYRGAVPVVALSAQAFVTDRERALEAGFDDHLAKPIRPQDLGQLLARVGEGAFMRAPNPDADPLEIVDEVDMLAELEQICGPEVFATLLHSAIDNIRAEHAALGAALAQGDESSARKAAHKLAGVMGQYSTANTALAATELETAEPGMLHTKAEALARAVNQTLTKLSERQARFTLPLQKAG